MAPATTRDKILLIALLLLAVAVWCVVLVLLLETTRQLLDTLEFIVQLGRMK